MNFSPKKCDELLSLIKYNDLIKEAESLITYSLIKKNCNLNIQNNTGKTALILAVMANDYNYSHYNKIKVIKLLIKNRANLDILDNYGNTALMYAIINEDQDIIKLLIKNRANLDIKYNNGNTVLMYAIIKKYKDIIKLLIKGGANLDLQNNNGNTALMVVANINNYIYSNSKFNLIKLLIDSGADLNIQNIDRNTVLMLIRYDFNENIIELLIKGGANLDLQNNNGNTALMLAIINEEKYIVKLLIEAGADVNIKNNEDKTAIMIAKDRNLQEIIKLLKIKHSDLTYSKLLTIENFNEFDFAYPKNFPTMIDNIYKFIKSIPNKVNNNKKSNINNFYAKTMYNFLVEVEYNKLSKTHNYNKKKITTNNRSELKDLITYFDNNRINYNNSLRIIYENQRGINAGGLSRQFFNNIEEQLNYYYQKKRFQESRIELLEELEKFQNMNKKEKMDLKQKLKNIIRERLRLLNKKINEDELLNINIENIKNSEYIENIPYNKYEYNGIISLEMLIKILALSYYNNNNILYNKIFYGNKYEIIINSIIKEFIFKNKFKKFIVNFYLQNPSEIINKEININSIKVIMDNYNSSNKNFLNKFNITRINNNNKNIINNTKEDKKFIDLIKEYYNNSPYTFYILHMIDFKIHKDKLIKNLTINFKNFNNNQKAEFEYKIISIIKDFNDEEIENFNFLISGSKKMCPKYIINIIKTNDSDKIEYHTCFYTINIYISNIGNKNIIINTLKANISVINKSFNIS